MSIERTEEEKRLERERQDELVASFVEIDILEKENFNIIVETLTRMGVANIPKKRLYQSCHILHKRGKYYIVHFKEMLALDGRTVNLEEDDIARRNTIAKTLEKWGMCRIVNSSQVESPQLKNKKDLHVVRYLHKTKWELTKKYTIGDKRR